MPFAPLVNCRRPNGAIRSALPDSVAAKLSTAGWNGILFVWANQEN
jgi:hypothetical protein